VKTPSAVPFTTGLTAIQALQSAGWFLVSGRRDHVVLIRRGPDGYQGYRLELTKALSGDDLSADPQLQPTDILYVPRSRIANLGLFVQQYIRDLLPIDPTGIAVGGF
jgi:polysaccharide export outer membrane protein